MATDGHGLRDLIIRHGWTRMATEFLKLKIKFQGKKTVSIRGHPCQKKKKKYESNAEIGTGT